MSAVAFDPADYTSWWTIHIFLLHWALVWTFRCCILRGWVLPKFTHFKFLDLWERRKRNVLSYMVTFVVSTCALLFQLYGGWNVLFYNYAVSRSEEDATKLLSESEIKWCTFSIQLVCVLKVWELVYRERIGWPLLLHHGLTLLFLQLLVITFMVENNSILYLRLALLIGFFATTNQISYISLWCFRLKILNPKFQRTLFWISSVQMFVMKAVITGGCAGYYFILVFSKDKKDNFVDGNDSTYLGSEDGDDNYVGHASFRDDTTWGNFWRYMFLPVLFQTFLAHFYVCQLLLSLSQRLMTIIRPGMSMEALERMQREYRLAVLILEAYENAPSSSVAPLPLLLSKASTNNHNSNNPHSLPPGIGHALTNNRRHYQTLLGSHHYFSNNYYHNCGSSNSRKGLFGGNASICEVAGGTSRNFGFYAADRDIPNTWNDILSSFPAGNSQAMLNNDVYGEHEVEEQDGDDDWSGSRNANLYLHHHNRQQQQEGRLFPQRHEGRGDEEMGHQYSRRVESEELGSAMEVILEGEDDDDSDSTTHLDEQNSHQYVLGALDVRSLCPPSTLGSRRQQVSTEANREPLPVSNHDDEAKNVFNKSFEKDQRAAVAAAWSETSLTSKPTEQQNDMAKVGSVIQGHYEQPQNRNEPVPNSNAAAVNATSKNSNLMNIRGSFLLTSSLYTHQAPLEDVPEEGPSMSRSSSSNNSNQLPTPQPQQQQPTQKAVEHVEQLEEDEDIYAQSTPSSSSSSYVEPAPRIDREQTPRLPFTVINLKGRKKKVPGSNAGKPTDSSPHTNNTANTDIEDEETLEDDGGSSLCSSDHGSQYEQRQHPRNSHKQELPRPGEQPKGGIYDEVELDPDDIPTNYTNITLPTLDETRGYARIEPLVEEATRGIVGPNSTFISRYSANLELHANSSSLVEAPTDDASFELPGQDYDVYQMRT